MTIEILSQLLPGRIDDNMTVLRAEALPVAEPSSPVQIPEPTSLKSSMPDLSPASRCRIYKRLYMRRKHGEAAGKSDALPPEMPETPHRIKPGRKSRPSKKRKTDEGSAAVEVDDDEDEEDDPRHPQVVKLNITKSRANLRP